MSALDLSRWQFGITAVYHFFFVPLTIGLSILVAGMQTAWFIKKDPAYLRMTKFGAPLAMEGLLVFFMESVFPGLWIFGWGEKWTYWVFRKRLSRSNIVPVDAIPTAVPSASLAAGQP